MDWKATEYSGNDSEERIRKLQALCCSCAFNSSSVAKSCSCGANGVQGILIIGGVDGFHAQFCQAVIKYLFLGNSGQELCGTQVINQKHELLEEMVLLVQSANVQIFYSSDSDSAVQVLPIITHWRHVREFVIHDEMDQDEQEARKIEAFKQMVSQLQTIGIPYGLDDHGNDLQDPMIPEKWPLVQSYGLDQVSQKGFFTMNHQVVNVSSKLRDTMLQMDDYTARRVARDTEPLLMHHFQQFLLKLDHAESSESRNSKSESEMAEDLASFYEFGTMQHDQKGLKISSSRGNRVLFGTRTLDLNCKSSSNVDVSKAGVGEFPASHFVVQMEDPFSGVRFVRSYFLATGQITQHVVDKDALVHPKLDHIEQFANKKHNCVDTKLLIEFYVLLLEAFPVAVKTFVESWLAFQSSSAATSVVSAQKLQDLVKKWMDHARQQALEQMESKQNALIGYFQSQQLALHFLKKEFLQHNLGFQVESLDSCGQQSQLLLQSKWNLAYFSMSLRQVPSQLVASETLGTLVVGDTFLLSKPVTGSESESESEFVVPSVANYCVNVTKSFPYFRSWIQHGREATFAQALEKTLQSDFMARDLLQLGERISLTTTSSNPALEDFGNAYALQEPDENQNDFISKAMILLESQHLPVLHGKLQLFSSGFFFKSASCNPIVVSFAKHVQRFQIVSTAFEDLVLLVLILKRGSTDAAVAKQDSKHEDQTNEEINPLAASLPFHVNTQPLRVALPLLSGTRLQQQLVQVLSVWKQAALQLSIPFEKPSSVLTSIPLTSREDRSSKSSEQKDVAVESSSSNEEELKKAFGFVAEWLAKRNNKPSGEELSTSHQQLFPKWFIPKDNSAAAIAGPSLPMIKAQPDLNKLNVPVTFVVGIPGSRASQVAHSICELSARTTTWHQVLVDFRVSKFNNTQHDESQTVLQEIRDALDQMARDLRALTEKINHPRLMVCVVGYVDPIAITGVFKHNQSDLPLKTRLSSVISVVNASNIFVPDAQSDPQNLLPCLMDQLTPGFCTHIVVLNASEVASHLLGRLRYRIQHTNPFADLQVLSFDAFEAPITPLLAVDRFESVYYQEYRRQHFSRWDKPASGRSGGWSWSGIDCMPVSFCFEVYSSFDREVFLEVVGRSLTPFAKLKNAAITTSNPNKEAAKGIRLAQVLATNKVASQLQSSQQHSSSSSESANQEMNCWCVEGRVAFTNDPSLVYEYLSTGTFSVLRPLTGDTTKQQPLELKFTGPNLNGERLRDLIRDCFPRVHSVAPLKTKTSVTLEEKREIQKQHAMDPLPEGYLYDGVNYVDFFGGRYEFHPDISKIVQDHLKSLNDTNKQNTLEAQQLHQAQERLVKQV